MSEAYEALRKQLVHELGIAGLVAVLDHLEARVRELEEPRFPLPLGEGESESAVEQKQKREVKGGSG